MLCLCLEPDEHIVCPKSPFLLNLITQVKQLVKMSAVIFFFYYIK